ncbi:MAG: pilin [Patescibacteria group bacterium]|nr:pilin [Patescibacteria group bacterium]MCL5258011.1 pilin [Patescibacteria group bacterium]
MKKKFVVLVLIGTALSLFWPSSHFSLAQSGSDVEQQIETGYKQDINTALNNDIINLTNIIERNFPNSSGYFPSTDRSDLMTGWTPSPALNYTNHNCSLNSVYYRMCYVAEFANNFLNGLDPYRVRKEDSDFIIAQKITSNENTLIADNAYQLYLIDVLRMFRDVTNKILGITSVTTPSPFPNVQLLEVDSWNSIIQNAQTRVRGNPRLKQALLNLRNNLSAGVNQNNLENQLISTLYNSFYKDLLSFGVAVVYNTSNIPGVEVAVCPSGSTSPGYCYDTLYAYLEKMNSGVEELISTNQTSASITSVDSLRAAIRNYDNCLNKLASLNSTDSEILSACDQANSNLQAANTNVTNASNQLQTSMNNISSYALSGGSVSVTTSSIPITVFPGGIFNNLANPSGYASVTPQSIFYRIEHFLNSLSVPLLILLITIGGLVYLLTPLSEEYVRKGHGWIKYAVVGYFLLLIASAIVALLTSILG